MRTGIKILLTVIAFIIGGFLIGVFKAATGSETPGVLGLVIGAGLIAGITAIWKYNPDKEQSKPEDKDKHILDKN